MHNLYAIFTKHLDNYEEFNDDLVNAQENIPHPDSIFHFSNLNSRL